MKPGRSALGPFGFLVAFALLVTPAGARPAARAADDPVELLLRDGRRLSGVEVALDGAKGGTLAKRDGSSNEIAIDDLVEVRLRSSSRGAARRSDGASTLLLHDGSRLVGAVADGDEESLRFELVAGGALTLPLDSVRALFCGPRHAELDLERFPGAEKGDSLHRRVEVGGDFTRGTAVALKKGSVRFEYSLGTADFPFDEVEALLLEQQVRPEEPKGLVAEVDLVPDGTLVAAFERLTSAEVVVKPASGGTVTLPREAVSALRFRGRNWEWLSGRAPSAVRQTPWLGSERDFLFPWRRDRSVTGKPLVIAGWRYGRGFGCHSRCELTFAHDGGAARLLLDVGLSDEVLALPDRGAVEFRVLVDGAEKWKSSLLHGGDAALHVGPITLDGAKSVTLVADFGTGDDIADRAIFAEPLLLR